MDTRLGRIKISERCDSITGLRFVNCLVRNNSEQQSCSPILLEAFDQLRLYMSGKLTKFSLPLSPDGTDFMKGVWQELCEIPYGETRSYKQIASSVNRPRAYRAIGLANNRNPIPIFIPCHRVIGSKGSIGGYKYGVNVKEKLLSLERINEPR